MKVEELLRKFGLDLPARHEEFIQQIKKLPLEAPKWLYAATLQPVLLQGDVVGPVRYVAVSEENDHALVEGNVMLVSNTCDLVPDQEVFSLVAPVIELHLYTKPEAKTEQAWSSHLTALRKFEVGPYYYLPSGADFVESFADFSRIAHLPTGYLASLFRANQSARKVSLSLKGHLLMLSKLAYWFVRLETDEVVRAGDAPSESKRLVGPTGSEGESRSIPSVVQPKEQRSKSKVRPRKKSRTKKSRKRRR